MAEDDFAKLVPRVKHVSAAAIRKKWKRLPSASHSVTREVIYTARDQSRRKRGRANGGLVEDCLNEVVADMIERLPRIPFPPGTEEQHFDYEANLNRMAKVEEQLTNNTHSMNLLRAQIKKEEALLKQDERELANLESAMKDNEAVRREQSRSLHPIVRDLGLENENIDILALDRAHSKSSMVDVHELFEDEDMAPILAQLQNHLLSLQQNVSDLRNVKEAVCNVSRDLSTYAAAVGNDTG